MKVLNVDDIHYPTDVCKERIAKELTKQLLPLIEYDIVDNDSYGTRDIVGTLTVLMK